jgi:hypothetical protein
MSYDKNQVIKSTLEGLQSKFDYDWEFRKAELTKDGLILYNHEGLKFKITMEFIGFEKIDFD